MEKFDSGAENEALPEAAAEQEATMEDARGERAGLLKRIFASRAADIGLNFVPGVDVIKLAAEGAVGKTLGGKELSGREQIDHAVLSGVLAVAYTLHLSGMHAEGMKARAAAALIAKIELGPEFLIEAAAMAREKLPKLANMLDKSGAFFQGARKRLLDNSAAAMHNLALGDNELVALELDH